MICCWIRKGESADLCDLFFQWVGGAAARRRILVDNPAALYDF